MSITRTGTSRQFPSFYNSQLTALADVKAVIDPEVTNDHLWTSIPAAALLHRPTSQTAWCKPAYNRGISGCLPTVTSIRPDRLKRRPSEIRIEDIDVALLTKFLNHLEVNRRNQPRTRNNRLAAIHGFFQYVAVSEPGLALQCQRVLAIPPKRYQRRPVEFLTADEAAALLVAPNPQTWIGRRDRALLLLAIQTGLRNSEITALRREDVNFGVGAHLRCFGKGRKMRCTPLRPDVAAVLKQWLAEQG
jgi:integrase